MLNDETTNRGSLNSCGSKCTRHELTLTSEESQVIWLTAHTWDQRCVASFCQVSTSNKANHTIKVGNNKPWRFYNLYGDLQLEPFSMEAGQSVTVAIEWNWGDR